MSSRDSESKKKRRLPGRVYTLLVTALATLLMAIPLMKPSPHSWTARAIVRHPAIQPPETARQLVRDLWQSTAEDAGMLANGKSKASMAALQSKLKTTTKPRGKGRGFTTTIHLRLAERQQARDLAGKIADGLADAADGNAQAHVVSIDVQPNGSVPRGKLVAALICSLIVGLTTVFFPRRRSRPAETQADKLDLVASATGLPVIGSVLSASREKTKKNPSNFPLRLTAFTAELVVASALLVTLVAASRDGNLLTKMIRSPLDAYAQSVRTASTQVQSMLQR